MSEAKVAIDTNDIWVPPGVGYSEQSYSSLSLVIEVDDPDSPLFLWGRTQLVALPGVAGAGFNAFDYIEHRPSEMTLEIVKLGGGAAPVAGDVAAGATRRGTTRLSRRTSR